MMGTEEFGNWGSMRACLEQGFALGSQGRMEEAAACYRQALQWQPDCSDAHFYLGVTLHQLGQLDQAAQNYKQALLLQPQRPDALNNLAHLGSVWWGCGDSEKAIHCFQTVLRFRPDYAEVHHNLGLVFASRGQFEQAAASYRTSLSLKPYYVEALTNLGIALASQGRLEEAADCHRQVIEWKPDDAAAHNNLGTVLAKQGRSEEALASYCQSTSLNPSSAEVWKNLGVAFAGLGRFEEAVASCRQAIVLRPDYADAHYDLAIALGELRCLDDAVASYRQAILFKPDFPEAHYNLGSILAQEGRLEEAEASFRQALLHNPDYAEVYNNLGSALTDQGRLDEAVACYHESLRLKPDCSESHTNLGNTLARRRRLQEAEKCYQEAIRLNPDNGYAHFNRSLLWLLQEDFARGWAEYEWRWKRAGFPPRKLPAPCWDGTPLDGRTILLHAEQGLGDTIQFLRYAPLVQQRGGRVFVECPPELLSLAATCSGIDRLIPRGSTLPDFQVHAALPSLPGIFATSRETVPNQVPYLHADAVQIGRYRDQLAGEANLKVAIVWQGNPNHKRDRDRSVPLAMFAPLAEVGGLALFSVQAGSTHEQFARSGLPVVDLGSCFDPSSLADLAAVLANMDLLISVDTAPAHLAGALGRPVWIALPMVPDWRWLLDRPDSPWYPTARLFRQQHAGDWTPVFEQMAIEIAKLVRDRTSLERAVYRATSTKK